MSEETEDIWYRFELLTNEPDDISARLWAMGVGGVEVQDDDVFIDPDFATPEFVAAFKDRQGYTTKLISFFQDDGEPDCLTRWEKRFAELPGDNKLLSLEKFEDKSWETRWMEFFKPLELSPRVMVGPPWEEFEAPENGFKLVIEPGMAFGTGTHETTQLCATILDEHLLSNEINSMLDVGCGSAILSMGASMLGAQNIEGIDIDAKAVEIAKEQLEANGFGDSIKLSDTELRKIDEQFDYVVANILAHILVSLQNDLRRVVAPGGLLLLCGIIEEDVPSIERAFLLDGWELLQKRQKNAWIAFELRKLPLQ